MAAVLRLVPELDYERLESQLDLCPQCVGAVKKSIADFLVSLGIDTIEDVTEEILIAYREYMIERTEGTEHQRKYYFHVLQLVIVSYYRLQQPEFSEKIIEYYSGSLPDRNRVMAYLMVNGIFSFEKITADVRDGLKRYIERTGVHWKDRTMKVLDLIKLEDTKRKNERSWKKPHRLFDGTAKIYLPYIADYNLAMEFVKIQDKDNLYFDFSKNAPDGMKQQFARMLDSILHKELTPYDRRVKWVFPLRFFFNFCVEAQVEDVSTLPETVLENYRDRVKKSMGTQSPFANSIVDKLQYFLFMEEKEINWDAHVWFSDRFSFKGERLNPANYPVAFSFYYLSDENKAYIKQFMKYVLGISSIAVNRANEIFKNVKRFARFCDLEGKTVTQVTAKDINSYFDSLYESEIRDKTFNTYMYEVWFFYKYLSSHEIIKEVPFDPALYRKKEYFAHNDRSIPEEALAKMFANMKTLSLKKRFMLLILLCTGLRINEVCTLRGDAFIERDNETWMKVYQYKMRSEKVVPVPHRLFQLLKAYIKTNGITPDEYIFKDAKGKAYRATEFGKFIKRWCKNIGIEDTSYFFRSHDARHTVASMMFDSNVSLQAIRDYLGHYDDTMTRQYIDYMPKKIDTANGDYFERTESLLKGGVKDGRKRRDSFHT